MGTAKKELHNKGKNRVVGESYIFWKLELTFCIHGWLSVYSHPKSICQSQSISGLHTSSKRRENECKYRKSIMELTRCSYVGLPVDSHPKFTCQTQSISGSHTSRLNSLQRKKCTEKSINSWWWLLIHQMMMIIAYSTWDSNWVPLIRVYVAQVHIELSFWFL